MVGEGLVVKVFDAHLSGRVWLILGNHRVEIAAAVSIARRICASADLSSIDADNIVESRRRSNLLVDFDRIGVPVAVSAAREESRMVIGPTWIIDAHRQLSVSWLVGNRKLSITSSSILIGDWSVRQMNDVPVSSVAGDVLTENIYRNLFKGF